MRRRWTWWMLPRWGSPSQACRHVLCNAVRCLAVLGRVCKKLATAQHCLHHELEQRCPQRVVRVVDSRHSAAPDPHRAAHEVVVGLLEMPHKRFDPLEVIA